LNIHSCKYQQIYESTKLATTEKMQNSN